MLVGGKVLKQNIEVLRKERMLRVVINPSVNNDFLSNWKDVMWVILGQTSRAWVVVTPFALYWQKRIFQLSEKSLMIFLALKKAASFQLFSPSSLNQTFAAKWEKKILLAYKIGSKGQNFIACISLLINTHIN